MMWQHEREEFVGGQLAAEMADHDEVAVERARKHIAAQGADIPGLTRPGTPDEIAEGARIMDEMFVARGYVYRGRGVWEHPDIVRQGQTPLCFICDEPWTDDHPNVCADWPEEGP